MTALVETIHELSRDWPKLHGAYGEHQWSLPPVVLNYIATQVKPDCRTLETGCGYSTIVFALTGCQHTVISPVAAEHARIREWGEQRGIDFSRVNFIAAKSEEVLPTLKSEPLQFALIDGWHGFPGPFLDWFFISRILAVRGLVVVDDVQIRACRLLRDFLRAESGRWRLRDCIGRSEVFEKLTNDLFVGDWETQPFGATPYRTTGEQVDRFVVRPIVRVAKLIPGIAHLARAAKRRLSS